MIAKFKLLLLFLIITFFSRGTYANCTNLKSDIERKIKSNGVKVFTLETVPYEQNSVGKVVGNCENKKYKIIYFKNNKSKVDATSTVIKSGLKFSDSYPPYFNGKQNLNVPYDEASWTGINWIEMSPDELVASLHTWRNDKLYYNSATWPANMLAIEVRIKVEQYHYGKSETLSSVINAYKTNNSDELFRFNLISFLSHASSYYVNHGLYDKPSDLRDCLLLATNDPSPWVRTEAVSALQFFRGDEIFEAAKKLEADIDSTVAAEAQKTVDTLTYRGWTSSE